jgi:hypothetical protein
MVAKTKWPITQVDRQQGSFKTLKAKSGFLSVQPPVVLGLLPLGPCSTVGVAPVACSPCLVQRICTGQVGKCNLVFVWAAEIVAECAVGRL